MIVQNSKARHWQDASGTRSCVTFRPCHPAAQRPGKADFCRKTSSGIGIGLLMGYFANALVFKSQPDFDSLVKINPGRFARGYRHNTKPFWLLDFWMPRGTIRRRVGPFCDPAFAPGKYCDSSLASKTLHPVGKLLSIFKAVSISPGIELEYVQFAIEVSRAAKNYVYCFAADDNDLDVGINASDGELLSFGIRSDCISFVFENNRCTTTPINLYDDDSQKEFARTLAKLKEIGITEIAEVRDGMDGQQLYEHPVGQWRFENGTAEEILGLGTWDPLNNLENDFEIVFEFEPL